MRYPAILAISVLALTLPAWAHKPIVVDGGATDADTAYVIDDVDVSQVAYHTRTETQPALWLRFQVPAGKTLDLQMGVPKIDRLEQYRPAMALVGPGLPNDRELPFTLPPGLGAVVFSTAETEPTIFDEEFTGTVSWQWPMQEYTVEQAGTYYLVGYSPTSEDGKFWVAIGTAEQFGLGDIVSLPSTLFAVRAFHETTPYGGLLGWAMLLIAAILAFFGFVLL